MTDRQRYERCSACGTLRLYPSGELAPDQSADVETLCIGHLGPCRHCPPALRARYIELLHTPGGIIIVGDALRQLRAEFPREGP